MGQLAEGVIAIGLMSGTSVDGIDAIAVRLTGGDRDLAVEVLRTETYAHDDALRSQILAVCGGAALSAQDWAALDDAIAIAFAQAAQRIGEGLPRAMLIGSHGQTVFHRPPDGIAPLGYSWQLGRGAAIAALTGIPTVSNFRTADVAAGGHGAPLVPRVDAYLLGHPTERRCVQNLGGIGNVTYLPPQGTGDDRQWETGVRGWDTGPGNVLIDLAVQRFSGGRDRCDWDGRRAAAGRVDDTLLDRWLQDPFFQAPPPKSTGREHFGVAYLDQRLAEAIAAGLGEDDAIATLTELTAVSVALNYQRFLPQLPDRVLLCGGGSRNPVLRDRIAARLGGQIPVQSTTEAGLCADSKEAIAFAVLGYWRWLGLPGNLPAVTGAQRAVPLGELWS
ncbi:MAG: anhydro-N-acetylmuramic acid kinase [Cyanophyceae cyanobacterium]